MKTDFTIQFYQDWIHLIKSLWAWDFNFINFTFICFEAEIDRIVGRIEINLGILGFNLFIGVSMAKMSKELESRIKKVSK